MKRTTLTSQPHDKLQAGHFMPVQQSPKEARPKLLADGLIEPPMWPEPAAAVEKRRVFPKIRSHDWSTALLFVTCDIVCWVVLYGFVGYARRDAFFVSPFEFMMVDFVALGVLLQALYIVGGYNRNTETLALTYTAEHILAIAGAAAVSSLLIYSAATFDAGMKPSRGVLLISFIVFLPLSLIYRREFRRKIAASTAQEAFLVVGSGELASCFYEAYKRSPNQQRLVFVDNDGSRVGSTIAGEGSPIVEGDSISNSAISKTLTAGSFSQKKLSAFQVSSWSGWCGHSFSAHVFTPWNHFTKHIGVTCRWT